MFDRAIAALEAGEDAASLETDRLEFTEQDGSLKRTLEILADA